MTASPTFSSARNVRSMHRAGAHVLELGAHERAALARLHVLELDDGHEPFGQVERHAVLQVVGGDAHSTRSLGVRVRGSAPVGGDDDGVLDAHAADAGEVHAGLDGDDVADEQGITGRRGDPRRLVDLEADAVTGAVRERVGPARVGDDVATTPGRPSAHATSAATASRPGLLALRARRRRDGARRDRVADATRCGSCRSSSRRRCTRSRTRRARCGSITRSLGTCVRLRAVRARTR